MALETNMNSVESHTVESNPVESLKEAARSIAALADMVGEQVRPAVKMAVDAAEEIASAVGADLTPDTTTIVVGSNPTRESLDEATRELGALLDTLGDQVRPAVKLAVDTADVLSDALSSARVVTDRLWKSLSAGLAQTSAATA